MITIKEPEFLLLPAISETRIWAMVTGLDEWADNIRKAFDEMAEVCANLVLPVMKELSELFKEYNREQGRIYARRRVRKLVQMQKRRRK